jgi:hypothetical protein
MTPARQRLGKYCVNAGIAAESGINLLGNGTQKLVFVATNIDKCIPVTRNRITVDN